MSSQVSRKHQRHVTLPIQKTLLYVVITCYVCFEGSQVPKTKNTSDIETELWQIRAISFKHSMFLKISKCCNFVWLVSFGYFLWRLFKRNAEMLKDVFPSKRYWSQLGQLSSFHAASDVFWLLPLTNKTCCRHCRQNTPPSCEKVHPGKFYSQQRKYLWLLLLSQYAMVTTRMRWNMSCLWGGSLPNTFIPHRSLYYQPPKNALL